MRRAPSKYHARRTTVEGITFHSAKEARRWQELKLLEKAGVVSDIKLQVVFLLFAFRDSLDLSLTPIGAYVADFSYLERKEASHNGTPFGGPWYSVVEDVKGYDTPLSKWKRKHVKAQYGIEVRLT